ncbi:aminotransferase class I/II-fold pyridoxal phosphate-dependent enzyme [Paenibacillus sp. 1011MAR3C5]|uniref:aminotransferase class I/II-fold pyridoxal phosphate-dependent enzyme n=1 Tax=Paenibacillus sp. 1011MAR3C5 TaxID=1675787 RepID=UPI000E6B565A|nr:aminotransferase class I/II-fold pyridoxal phosphate-dependent enzyme [Paenibacillus sp. 1011MAR3C5]RJE83538.1 aminotransferase class I/II-fold pyridoxal phosphate-dependent enzyme [Paenibacillus sp. 1011MAR3C5]
MGRINAPLFEALMRHAGSSPTSFHVPGHHNGEALLHALHTIDPNDSLEIGKQLSAVMRLDLTELSSTDDLHHPEGAILAAQRLAAQCYGAEETCFLIGGSTSGNLGMILAVCDPGDIIIVQRNVHKSVINGMKLAGAKAIFLTPHIDSSTGISTIPSLEQVKLALRQYPQAKAVFLTNPNYYGMSVKLDAYVEACHEQNKPLLIDEAHGAHYGMHPDLPNSAIQAGADGVVQSTHKTLPALTMGAMLHMQGQLLDRRRVREALAMVQSSSPSFPIMASLDISRAIVDKLGGNLFHTAIEAVHSFRIWVKESKMIFTVGETELHPDKKTDPLRLILTVPSGKLTGFELHRELEKRGCWAEMSDPLYTVLVIGPHVCAEGAISRLKDALTDIHHAYASAECRQLERQEQMESKDPNEGISEPVSFARVKKQTSRSVPLHEALHHPSAEMIIPYPPGIPLLYPGERFTDRHLADIRRLSDAGARFQGAEDSTMDIVAILIEEKC